MTRFIFIVAILVFALCGFVARAGTQVNVTQKNNNPSRDGLYIDPAFTPANAATLVRDLNFNGTIVGNVHAQPLYIEGGPNGPMIIAVTASNNIYALNASTGAVIWQRTDIGPSVTSGLPCGNVSPVGTLGTPVVDLASRSLFFDALVDGATKKHFIYSLNVDTGATERRLAGGCERHCHVQRYTLQLSGAGRPRCTRSGERDRVRALLRIFRRLRELSWLGSRRADKQSLHGVMAWATTAAKAAFGGIAALPATAPTCS